MSSCIPNNPETHRRILKNKYADHRFWAELDTKTSPVEVAAAGFVVVSVVLKRGVRTYVFKTELERDSFASEFGATPVMPED